MATLRNKKELAPLKKENHKELPRSNMAQNSNVPRPKEDYITQVSEEIEERVRKKLSEEFSWRENRILGALLRLDDFRKNALIHGHSGTAPEMSRNEFGTNQGTNEDDSQSDPHLEVGIFHNQMTQTSGPEDGQEMVTGVNEKVKYCSASKSSGKTENEPLYESTTTRQWNYPWDDRGRPLFDGLSVVAKQQQQFCTLPQ